jgi:hypothetical protein
VGTGQVDRASRFFALECLRFWAFWGMPHGKSAIVPSITERKEPLIAKHYMVQYTVAT